ncbi:MAG: hypothetical protein BRC29_01060 [Nanohaloarchaea archaeon SW_7_43_1]|nr:MAG: hypothetical protein BRC29_01060 [Nanohaloarchaea archaeon SW_7_43_1]
MENKEILVLLGLVVVASGCSHTASQSTSSSSVTIQNFSAFPSNVLSDQQVRLKLTLKNNGDSDAESVQARLFNVAFSGERNWNLDGERSIRFGTLQSADEERNLPARESTKYWSLDSPSLDEGATIPYRFITRVYYKYQTTGTSSITLMGQRRYRQQGNPERPTLDTTSGPIQMEIRTRSPIVFYPQDDSSRTTKMCVIVTNKGTGTPFVHNQAYDEDNSEYNLERENSNKVKLRVKNQGNTNFTSAESGDESQTVLVDMLGNRGIGCFSIDVRNWNNNVGPQQDVPVLIEADYGYVKETSSSATVSGTDRFR